MDVVDLFFLLHSVICRRENVYFAETLKELESSQVNSFIRENMMKQKQNLKLQT